MTAEELKAIRDKEGWPGVVSHIFIYLHEGPFSTMTDSDLREILVEIETSEDSKDGYLLFKTVIELEEEYRATA